MSEGTMATEPTRAELQAQIDTLTTQIEAAKTAKKTALEFRVGEKGGVSVYGLGRFPITLYFDQWKRLLDVSNELWDFLVEAKDAGKLSLERPAKQQNTTAKVPAGSQPNRLQALRIAFPGKTDAELSAIASLGE